MPDQMKAAIIRGAYNAIGTFLVAFLFSLSQGISLEKSSISGGIAALAVLGFRSIGEGTYDTGRAIQAIKGNASAIKPSDVGSYSPPLTVRELPK